MALGAMAHFASASLGSSSGGAAGGSLRGLSSGARPGHGHNGNGRNHILSTPRPHSTRNHAALNSASAFLDTEYRAITKGPRVGYAVPVPDFASVRLAL